MADNDDDEKLPEEEFDFPEEKIPERPLECSECKKPIAVKYTEIVGHSIIHTSMCADCPELERRLHGIPSKTGSGNASEAATGLACGNCGTTLESLRHGNPLGCSICYDVFGDILVNELISSEKIPSKLFSKKNMPLHMGRIPGETQEINTSSRLLALNEALNETLKREDYEQAAWLRDQIKALTENPEKTDERK